MSNTNNDQQDAAMGNAEELDFTDSLMHTFEELSSVIEGVDSLEMYEDQGAQWFKSKDADVCQICLEPIDFVGDGVYSCTHCGTEWDITTDDFYVEELGYEVYTFLVLEPEPVSTEDTDQ